MALTLKSTMGSYVAPTTSGNVIGKISQCELLLEDDTISRVVAIGKVFEGVTTLHNVALRLMW